MRRFLGNHIVIAGSGNAAGSGPTPTIQIDPTPLSHAEGNSGTTNYVYTLTRSGDLTLASSALWTVSGSGPAPAAAADFVGAAFPTGTALFAAGATTVNITVPVAGDSTVESDEAFIVTLSNPIGALLGANITAGGTITNDDASGAPVLSLVSASGASPVKLRATGDVPIGTFVELKIVYGITGASDAIFAAGAGGIGSNGVTNFKVYEILMQGQAWELGDSTIDAFVEPAGPYTAQAQFRTNPDDPANSVDSALSNKVSDTITASSAQFAHTTTTDYKNTLTFTNAFKSITAQDQGAFQGSRATIAGADKGQVEFTITSFSAVDSIRFGFEDGTTDFSAFNALPGVTNSNGVQFSAALAAGIGYTYNSSGTDSGYSCPDNNQVGDTFSIIPNRTTGAVKIYRTRSGASVLLGTLTVPGLSGFTRAWAAAKNTSTVTANFGGSTFAHTLDSGDVIYG